MLSEWSTELRWTYSGRGQRQAGKARGVRVGIAVSFANRTGRAAVGVRRPVDTVLRELKLLLRATTLFPSPNDFADAA